MKYNESGRTMVEMMGVLAIIGVIMYGAIASITWGVDLYKVTATFNDLEQAAADIKDLYSWTRGVYPDSLHCVLCQEGLDPLTDPRACPDCDEYATFSSRWAGVTIKIDGNECTVDGDKVSCFVVVIEGLSDFARSRLYDMEWNQLSVDDQGDITDQGNRCQSLALCLYGY